MAAQAGSEFGAPKRLLLAHLGSQATFAYASLLEDKRTSIDAVNL
jgi:hypothetical protein